MQNYYKVFFTISFEYKIGVKKTVSKSFKSDCDIDSSKFNNYLNDKNVLKEWEEYALNQSLNKLNPKSEFEENKVSAKEIKTHRIVNLKYLTEVF